MRDRKVATTRWSAMRGTRFARDGGVMGRDANVGWKCSEFWQRALGMNYPRPIRSVARSRKGVIDLSRGAVCLDVPPLDNYQFLLPDVAKHGTSPPRGVHGWGLPLHEFLYSFV